MKMGIEQKILVHVYVFCGSPNRRLNKCIMAEPELILFPSEAGVFSTRTVTQTLTVHLISG